MPCCGSALMQFLSIEASRSSTVAVGASRDKSVCRAASRLHHPVLVLVEAPSASNIRFVILHVVLDVQDYALFVEAFRETGGTWIMKPSGSAEGRGIFLFSRLSDVKAWAKPHLIRGMKRRVEDACFLLHCQATIRPSRL